MFNLAFQREMTALSKRRALRTLAVVVAGDTIPKLQALGVTRGVKRQLILDAAATGAAQLRFAGTEEADGADVAGADADAGGEAPDAPISYLRGKMAGAAAGAAAGMAVAAATGAEGLEALGQRAALSVAVGAAVGAAAGVKAQRAAAAPAAAAVGGGAGTSDDGSLFGFLGPASQSGAAAAPAAAAPAEAQAAAPRELWKPVRSLVGRLSQMVDPHAHTSHALLLSAETTPGLPRVITAPWPVQPED
jgi:hypothetical protein